jgi:hypothetical protein
MGYGMYTATQDQWAPPHEELSPRLFWIVEAALRKAWEILTSDSAPAAGWRIAKEDDLTLELFEVLKDIVWQRKMIPGFNNTVFSTINREPKVRNYNREHPDKMPDLLIEFADIPSNVRASQAGIFIECKPVDIDHPVGTHYLGKGIARFVNGDYAWWMRDAIMLGYAAEGYTIEKKLIPRLSPKSKAAKDAFTTAEDPVCCPQSISVSSSEKTWISKHFRTFTYCETHRAAPEITLRHVWLRRYEVT